MNCDLLKGELLASLKKRDPQWISAVAKSSGKPPADLTYDDLANIRFGEFTMGRITSDVEHLFCVCLPLDMQCKKWTVTECFSYLQVRAQKKDINLKLAANRAAVSDRPTVAALIIFFGYLFLLSSPVLLIFLWQRDGALVFLYAVPIAFISFKIFDTVFTRMYYLRLIRRIETSC